MKNIGFAKNVISQITNKDQASGYTNADEINNYFKLAQLDEISYLIGSAKGKQMSAYERDSRVTASIQKLKKTKTINLSAGQAAIPTGFMLHGAGWLLRTYKDYRGEQKMERVPLDMVTDAQWVDRQYSQINTPNLTNPIIRYTDGNIEVLPIIANTITLQYLVYPPDPDWAYTISVNDEEVYNDAASTDFYLPTICVPNIIYRVCAYLGIEIRRQDLVQIMENYKATPIQ